MAAGRICTGFSKPYVAKYAAGSGSPTYSNGMLLARGVNVKVEASSSDDNSFYADNMVAESSAGKFSSGTLTLTVDGLLDAAEELIYGLTASGTDSSEIHYGDSMAIPYVGVGFIARYQAEGVTSYVAVVLPKCRFSTGTMEAKTQEDSIEWQTQELSAKIERSDNSNHDWRIRYAAVATEELAEAKIKTFFSIT